MPSQQVDMDPVFKALSDPTRRAVIEQLSHGPAAVSELAAPFQMALPSFLQHLRLLKVSGLVSSTKRGRVRTFTLEPKRLQLAEDWMHEQLQSWERRLDQLDAHLMRMKQQMEIEDDGGPV